MILAKELSSHICPDVLETGNLGSCLGYSHLLYGGHKAQEVDSSLTASVGRDFEHFEYSKDWPSMLELEINADLYNRTCICSSSDFPLFCLFVLVDFTTDTNSHNACRGYASKTVTISLERCLYTSGFS